MVYGDEPRLIYTRGVESIRPAFWPSRGDQGIVWTQRYDPLGNWLTSTLLAALPVLVLLALLAMGRTSAWKAAFAGLATACGLAWLVFGMPARMIVASAAVGMVFAVFRIVWLIVAAVFLYDITVATGQFEVMKASVARLSADRRLQMVLVAFCFGALIEGSAGFGAPGGDLWGILGRARVRAVPGSLPLFDRQHRTCGVGRYWHPHCDLEQGHRAGRPRARAPRAGASCRSFRWCFLSGWFAP